MKLNLVGDTFTYTHDGNKGYSCHGKAAKHMTWIQDGSGQATCFVDGAIIDGLSQKLDQPKYGWLLESKFISGAANHVRQNLGEYVESYDMIFTHEKELIDVDRTFRFVPGQGSWIKEPQIYPKSKLVSMISSSKTMTEGHHVRLNWVERLRGNLDLYGRSFNPIDFKEQGLNDYHFSVAIENGVYESYFTEKIVDCFLTGTIPIYLGTPDIGEFFNPDGIIALTDDFDINSLSPELYLSKMEAIEENFEKALKMEVLEDFFCEMYL